jgi:Protein of unknown function (DUF3987)/Bifunctional DNA primase/polymerase, N-terminal/Primase C terminal 1 (PriCT-1)
LPPEPSMVRAALWYAKHGLPVFPVHSARDGRCTCGKVDCEHPGKHPRTAHGHKDATTDTHKIEAWWQEWPSANIAIPTGAVSGLFVLDIDPRNGGNESLEHLVAEHGPLPDTAEQMTGGGGRHIVLRHPGIAVPKTLAQGIDLKGDGGYIVVAPSIHVSGKRYEWDGIAGARALLDPAPVPAWLLHLITVTGNGGRGGTTNEHKLRTGERNNRLTSLAGSMRRRGMTPESIEAALFEENRWRCEPPLPDAEIRRIAASIAKYPPAQGTNGVTVAADWSEPIPFVHVTPDPIPVESLPGWLGEMARATADNTETPFDLPALLGAAVASACVAGKAVVSPEPGYNEPLNIYTCPAMESGNRKTAVLTALLEPFLEWERERIGEIEPERMRLASERRTIEARIENRRKKAASAVDPSALMREIRELEESLPLVPASPRLYTEDCTPERLASLMAEQGGRMAVFSDEGGVFDIIGGRYSQGIPNLDLWLKGHSVSSVRVDRSDRMRPPILINRPHLTVGISPQPEVLESLRDKPGFRGRGLLARLLYGLPTSPLGYRTLEARAIPIDVASRYRNGIRRLLTFTPENEICLRLGGPAYAEWKAFQRSVEIQFREGGKLQDLRDWGSKLPGAALRLAGIFHFVEHLDRVSAFGEIALSTMILALELAACLVSHARAVFALMERDANVENAEKLVGWIKRQGKPSFSVRECFRAHQSRFKRVDAMLPVLLLVEQHGYIRRLHNESSGGRKPSDVCEVNPAVLNSEGAV